MAVLPLDTVVGALALVWDWHGLTHAWDWPGIFTHLGIEEVASLCMAGILFFGRYHARHSGLLHKFAHSVKAQFAIDTALDILIAIATIQVLHL